MKALPKSLQFRKIDPGTHDLAHQRVSRACADGYLRILESAVDQTAPFMHEAVVLVGREIAGWLSRYYIPSGDRAFEAQLEIAEQTGQGKDVQVSADFLVTSDRRWLEVLQCGIRPNGFPRSLEPLRWTMRSPRPRERFSTWNPFEDSYGWDRNVVGVLEERFEAVRVCSVRPSIGPRGADHGPVLDEKFLSRSYDSDGWSLERTLEQFRRTKQLWEMKRAAVV